MSAARAGLRRGFARLLDVHESIFDRGGLEFVETAVRDEPEWANWVLPIWFVALGRTVVCSVSPRYAAAVRAAFHDVAPGSLLRPGLIERGRRVVDSDDWLQRELFFYGRERAPEVPASHAVVRLSPGPRPWEEFLRSYDGGVYAVCGEDGDVLAHAGVKDKGLLQEIAVGVAPEVRRRGLGKAVVARAVADVVAAGKVPLYVPDDPTNTASYALCTSLGFEKGGETLLWAYELPDWGGFPVGAEERPPTRGGRHAD